MDESLHKSPTHAARSSCGPIPKATTHWLVQAHGLSLDRQNRTGFLPVRIPLAYVSSVLTRSALPTWGGDTSSCRSLLLWCRPPTPIFHRIQIWTSQWDLWSTVGNAGSDSWEPITFTALSVDIEGELDNVSSSYDTQPLGTSVYVVWTTAIFSMGNNKSTSYSSKTKSSFL